MIRIILPDPNIVGCFNIKNKDVAEIERYVFKLDSIVLLKGLKPALNIWQHIESTNGNRHASR